MDEQYVNIMLPERLVDNVREIVDSHDGLFEDETDYIIHSIIDNNMKFRK